MTISEMQQRSHDMALAKGFWWNYRGLDDYAYEAMKVALVISELSEALEALRSNDGTRGNFGEELADAMIRIGDLAHATGVNLQQEITDKMAKNAQRPVRHGKRF